MNNYSHYESLQVPFLKAYVNSFSNNKDGGAREIEVRMLLCQWQSSNLFIENKIIIIL